MYKAGKYVKNKNSQIPKKIKNIHVSLKKLEHTVSSRQTA